MFNINNRVGGRTKCCFYAIRDTKESITTYDNFTIYINYLSFITTCQVKYMFFLSNQTMSYMQNQNPNLICTSFMHTVVRSNAYCKQGSVNSRSKAGTRISSTWALSKSSDDRKHDQERKLNKLT